jgi:hypothetical protein
MRKTPVPWSVRANEAHNRVTRRVPTRKVAIRIIRVAHEAEVRRLAMEALPDDASP